MNALCIQHTNELSISVRLIRTLTLISQVNRWTGKAVYRRAFSTQRLPLFPAPYTKWKRNNLYRVYNYLFGFIFCHINCLITFKKVILNFNHFLFILALVSSHRREVRYYRNKIMSIQGYKHTQRDITVSSGKSITWKRPVCGSSNDKQH